MTNSGSNQQQQSRVIGAQPTGGATNPAPTEPKLPVVGTPSKDPLPINGQELVALLLGDLARELSNHARLHEMMAYPGAKVEFALRVTPFPVEEGNSFDVKVQKILDFGNPPDVLRILAGLPVWGSAKVVLDGYVGKVDTPAEPSPALVEAARKVAEGRK